MAVTHSTAARDAAADAVTPLIGASGNLVFRLTGTVSAPGTAVAASGSDINMSNGLTVANGDTVSCSSLTYTALSA